MESFAQWMQAETAVRSKATTAAGPASAEFDAVSRGVNVARDLAAAQDSARDVAKSMNGNTTGGSLSGSSRFGITVGLSAALRQGQPGGWASDHREETNHFTGWNYIAISAIAKQAAQAEVTVFQDAEQTGLDGEVTAADPRVIEKRQRRRKALIRQFGLRKAVEILGDEQQLLPQSHRLCRLLKRPNPQQSGASFRYEMVIQLGLTGTCLIWNVPNKLGMTVERYVIPTSAANPIQPSARFPRGAWQIIPPSQWTAVDTDGFADMPGWMYAYGAIIPAENMQVIRWPHPARKDDGYSPLAAGSLQIDTAEQVDRTRWHQMQNGPSPSLFVTPGDDTDPDESELERAQTRFNQQYAGAKNAGKAIFGTSKTQVVPLSTTPKDMDYMSAFTQLRDVIMALHGVPGVAAGMTDSGTYAALYASLTQFVRLTVGPYLSLIADEETEQLAPQYGPGLTVEIEAASIDDPTILETALRTDITAGIRTVDEFRSVRGLPPFGGEVGNRLVGGQPPPGAAGVGGPGATGTPGATGSEFGNELQDALSQFSADSTGVSGMPGATVPSGSPGTVPAAKISSPRQKAIAGAVQEFLQTADTPDDVRAILKDAYREYP